MRFNRAPEASRKIARRRETALTTMRGEVFAVTGPAFANWLGGSAATTGDQASMAAEGEALFMRLGCAGRHGEGGEGSGGAVKAPALIGLHGSRGTLSGGKAVDADDRYSRDSILQPEKEVVLKSLRTGSTP